MDSLLRFAKNSIAVFVSHKLSATKTAIYFLPGKNHKLSSVDDLSASSSQALQRGLQSH